MKAASLALGLVCLVGVIGAGAVQAAPMTTQMQTAGGTVSFNGTLLFVGSDTETLTFNQSAPGAGVLTDVTLSIETTIPAGVAGRSHSVIVSGGSGAAVSLDLMAEWTFAHTVTSGTFAFTESSTDMLTQSCTGSGACSVDANPPNDLPAVGLVSLIDVPDTKLIDFVGSGTFDVIASLGALYQALATVNGNPVSAFGLADTAFNTKATLTYTYEAVTPVDLATPSALALLLLGLGGLLTHHRATHRRSASSARY